MIEISGNMIINIFAKLLGISCFTLSILAIAFIVYKVKNKIELKNILQTIFAAIVFFILGLYGFQIIVIV